MLCFTETLSHWQLPKLLEAARYFALMKGLADFPSIINQIYGIFVYGVVYHIDTAFWRIPRNKNFPFKVFSHIYIPHYTVEYSYFIITSVAVANIIHSHIYL